MEFYKKAFGATHTEENRPFRCHMTNKIMHGELLVGD